MIWLAICLWGIVLLGITMVLSISEIPDWIVYTIMYIGIILFAVGGFGVALF